MAKRVARGRLACVLLLAASSALSCSDDGGTDSGPGEGGEAAAGAAGSEPDGGKGGKIGAGAAAGKGGLGGGGDSGASGHAELGGDGVSEGGTETGGASPDNDAGSGGSGGESGGDGGSGEAGSGGDAGGPSVQPGCDGDSFAVVGQDGCFECPGYVYEPYAVSCSVFAGARAGNYTREDHRYDPVSHELRLRAGAGLPIPLGWSTGEVFLTFAEPGQEDACPSSITTSVDGLDLVADLSSVVGCEGLIEVVLFDSRPDYGCANSMYSGTYVMVTLVGEEPTVGLTCESINVMPPIMFGSLEPVANEPRFSSPASGGVADSLTGLVWQQEADGDYPALSQANAVDHCAGLDHAGFTDWRLPTPYELHSIVNLRASKSAANFHDLTSFPTSPAVSFWTTAAWASLPDTGWVVDFGPAFDPQNYLPTALSNGWELTEEHAVRCVRGGPAPVQRFVDHGDGTATDHLTGKTWERIATSAQRSAVDSQAYCRDLTLAGGGWRVPTLLELVSLVDFDLEDPAIDTAVFPDTVGQSYWTTTPTWTEPELGWAVDFYDGFLWAGDFEIEYRTRCVR